MDSNEIMVSNETNAIQTERHVCGAQLRGKPGRYCQKPPVVGRERCRLHGGNQARGVNHHLFKTGKHSRDLPTHLAERYEAARNDAELLNLQDDIAASDARTGELFSKLQENFSILESLQEAGDNLLCASTDENQTEEVKDALREIERLIKQLNTLDRKQWQEIRATMELRRRLTEAESKRQAQMRILVRMDEFEAFIVAVFAAIGANVTRPEERAAVGNEISRLISRVAES